MRPALAARRANPPWPLFVIGSLEDRPHPRLGFLSKRRMTAHKSLKPRPTLGPAEIRRDIVEDLETQRRLRRDLKLTDEDLADIDLDVAIEAGLLSKPNSRRQ